ELVGGFKEQYSTFFQSSINLRNACAPILHVLKHRGCHYNVIEILGQGIVFKIPEHNIRIDSIVPTGFFRHFDQLRANFQPSTPQPSKITQDRKPTCASTYFEDLGFGSKFDEALDGPQKILELRNLVFER